MYAIQEMLVQMKQQLNFSKLWSTVYYQEQELSMCDLTLKLFTSAHHLVDQNMWKFNCPKFLKNSLQNTTSPAWCIKFGYISKSIVGVMVCPNRVCWQTSISDWDCKKRDIMKQGLPRVYGDTNGDLSNFFGRRQLWRWICGKTTCISSSHNIEEISQYHSILGRQEIFWDWLKMGLWQKDM